MCNVQFRTAGPGEKSSRSCLGDVGGERTQRLVGVHIETTQFGVVKCEVVVSHFVASENWIVTEGCEVNRSALESIDEGEESVAVIEDNRSKVNKTHTLPSPDGPGTEEINILLFAKTGD